MTMTIVNVSDIVLSNVICRFVLAKYTKIRKESQDIISLMLRHTVY